MKKILKVKDNNLSAIIPEHLKWLSGELFIKIKMENARNNSLWKKTDKIVIIKQSKTIFEKQTT